MVTARTSSIHAVRGRVLRSGLAAVVVSALAVGGLTVTAPAAVAADGSVTGTVFRDFNGNGALDSGHGPRTGVANDTGLEGVTVTATDGRGTVVGQVTSSADGTYTIPVTGAADSRIRVEFTHWPSQYQPSGTSSTGTNGTSVQFAEIGASGVDFALNAPEDYAQDVAPLLTTIQHGGSPFASEGGTAPATNGVAVAGISYDAARNTNQPSGFPGRVGLATFGEVGAVGTVVYQPQSNSAFVFATLKRQSGLGSLGLGGIYRISNVLDADGRVTDAGTVTPWLDISTIGVDLGTAASNSARGIHGPTTAANDTFGFANAGKIGFGGATLSPDGKKIFFVNLNDKKLYSIDVSDPSVPPTAATSYDLGLGTGERPWAVSVYRDQLLVGYVTTGETGAGAQPGQSAAAAGLTAHVISAPLANPTTWTPALSGGLGYAKGDVYNNQLVPQSQRWNTWTDTWTWNASGSIPAGRVAQNNGGWHIYPQPILSSLYVDEGGYLTLGFSDRSGVQGGNRNLSSDPAVPGTNYETGSSGDLLLAAPNSDGTYTLELNGAAGDRPTTPPSAGRANEGPGNREFYNDGQNLGNGGHREVTLGSVAGQRGTGTVVSTAFDPLAGIRLGGLAWYDNTSGAAVGGYEMTADGGSGPSPDGTFQKGGGFGATTLLAKRAPVELGNRVWFDADQDGIQDADEPAIAGVTVELRDPTTGAVIATKTTDADGEYYFRSDVDGFDPNGTYAVAFIRPTTGSVDLRGPNATTFGTVEWSDALFTKAGQGSDPAASSDPDPATGLATVTLGGPGHNDHTIDAGFVANTSFTVQKTIDPAGGTAQPGQTFAIALEGRSFRGEALALPQSSLTLTKDQTSTPISVPVGSSVKVTETSTGIKTIAIVDPDGNSHVGLYRLQGSGKTFAFRVDNTLYRPGKISVAKSVTGDFSLTSPELAAAVFTVDYTYAGGSGSLALTSGNSWTATSGDIPYGAVVTLSERTPTGTPSSVGFSTPTWSAGGQPDGTATTTVGDGITTNLVLTNPTTSLVGTFAVQKSVIGDAANRVPNSTPFVVEYSVDGGSSWTALPAVQKGATVTGPSLPAGTAVTVREQPRPALPDVEWGPAAFSGSGVTATGETGTFTIASGATAQVLLENPTTPRDGRFSVTKDVTGAGENLLVAGTQFHVDYTSTAGNGRLTVTNGGTATSPLLPTGTVVTITEVAPTSGLPAGANWGTPALVIGGTPAANGSTLTIGDDTVIGVGVQNPTTVTPSVDIHKGDGTGTTIAHEADTVAAGETYAPGETRDVVIRVENTGPEPLRDVALTDATLAGGAVKTLTWTFPNGETAAADYNAVTGVWTATWASTFGTGTSAWAPGAIIVGHATLTIGAGDGAHQDRATVSAKGQFSGTTVGDENDYNAFTGAVQVIKYDGEKTDPTVRSGGDWIVPAKPLTDASQDANTEATAVKYPVETPQRVRWVVTNTGDTWLTNFTLTDTTLSGPKIGDDWTADLSAFGGPATYSFAASGPWAGLLPPNASFFAEGTLTLPKENAHADRVDVVGTVVVPATDSEGKPTDQPKLDGGTPVSAKKADGSPFTVDDDDPFHAYTGVGPIVDIQKGDGTGTTITHEADTLAAGESYQPGETRTIVFRVTNTGDEPLVDVVLKDETISGGIVQGLEWTLPNGTKVPATLADKTWTANWAGPWQPEAVITGTATLTVGADSAPHVDGATVTGKGQASGIPVTDRNDYNAFTGSIQVIKYDGDKPDPAVGTATAGWTVPAKPLADPDQDANDLDHAVKYPVGTTNPVRWVVTNTGDTWLTGLTLVDTTNSGPKIGDDWTADLSAFGGPADYSFVKDGPWAGLLPPKASFFAKGTLTLAAEQRHTDTVDVVGTVVVPAVGTDGVTPTGQPLVNAGKPVTATIPNPANPGERVPFTVDDNDPFNAWTGIGPFVDIEKGDGSGTEIVHDADTNLDGQLYENGETRTIVFRVQNTGDEDLVDVVLNDGTISGGVVEGLTWTLPDGKTLTAVQDGTNWTARWEATFGEGQVTWKPGEWITGSATLTLAGGEPHVDRATVNAVGVGSGIPVTDRDDYNAFTSGIQVIKYDGAKADPAVKDAGGAWITPVKPLVDADQDANDSRHAVEYTADTANVVRWVVTNTGSTWLTSVDLADLTDKGPAVSAWTADLSAFGGPAAYDFTANGTWHGLIPPGASFFAQGVLTLGANTTHADTVTVIATPVIPEVDEIGKPTGAPERNTDGSPVVVTKDGAPVRITDSDPFHAYTLPATPLAITGMNGLVILLGVPALLAIGLGVLLAVGKRRRPVTG